MTTVSILDDRGRDHKPLLTTLTCKQKPKRSKKQFWNFKKANWNKYAFDTDTGFEKKMMPKVNPWTSSSQK